MKYWFTADTHLGHSAIIRYANRPFDNIEQMNKTILKNHNKLISQDDTVFFLGDFQFGSKDYASYFNGKWIFIQGNHDNSKGRKAIIQRLVIDHGGKKLLLVHNPVHITKRDANYYDIALTAHVHNNWKISTDYSIPAINVGVDVWDFKPHTINKILGRWYKYKNKHNGTA